MRRTLALLPLALLLADCGRIFEQGSLVAATDSQNSRECSVRAEGLVVETRPQCLPKEQAAATGIPSPAPAKPSMKSVMPGSASATTAALSTLSTPSSVAVDSHAKAVSPSTSRSEAETPSPSIASSTSLVVKAADGPAFPGNLNQSLSDRNVSHASLENATVIAATVEPDNIVEESESDVAQDAGPAVEVDESLKFPSFQEWKEQRAAPLSESSQTTASTERPKQLTDNTQGKQDEHANSVAPSLDAKSANETRTNDTHSATGTAVSTDKKHGEQRKTKQPKDRFNFGSFDCGAVILASNPGASSTTSILKGDKDRYMLNVCDTPEKYVAVELCEEILVDTIVLANYEFFSSMVKTFRVLVSNRYPPKKEWTLVGTFEAHNNREPQAFKIANPAIWAKYLRIELESHYGSEYYCPLSVLKVYGSTMMEDLLKDQEKKSEMTPDPVPTPLSPAPLETVFGKDTLPNIQKGASNNPSNEGGRNTETVGNAMTTTLLSLAVETATLSEPTKTPTPPTPIPPKQSPLLIDLSSDSNTQDSVFKTILKRLGRLEDNFTLSIGYIEQQGARIQEVFSALEQTHRWNLQQFIQQVNNTAHENFESVKESYMDMWAEIVTELRSYQDTVARHLLDFQHSVDTITYEVSLLQRWAVVQLLLMAVLLLFGPELNRQLRTSLDRFARQYGIDVHLLWRNLTHFRWPFARPRKKPRIPRPFELVPPSQRPSSNLPASPTNSGVSKSMPNLKSPPHFPKPLPRNADGKHVQSQGHSSAVPVVPSFSSSASSSNGIPSNAALAGTSSALKRFDFIVRYRPNKKKVRRQSLPDMNAPHTHQ